MKKLLLGIFILLAIAACKPKTNQQPSKLKPAQSTADSSARIPVELPDSSFTLDGLSVKEADAVISRFIDNSTSSDSKTNIWFSINWVKKVDKLLVSKQNADSTIDGIRIYFAKNANTKNTIVVVFTKHDTNLPGVHSDYFIRDSSMINTRKSSSDFVEDYTGNDGADLYTDSSVCNKENGCIISTLNHRVSCKKAFNYVQNFDSKPINVVSEWFPLNELKLLSDELIKAPAGIKADGVRIYFAKNSKKRDVLIIVTTQKGTVEGSHMDNYNCYVNLSKAEFNKRYFWSTEDHGEECPINCEGVSWPEQEQ